MSNSTQYDDRAEFRILVIDDNPAIHDDFRKVLGASASAAKQALDQFETVLFGTDSNTVRGPVFHIDSAFQGQEGLEKVRLAAAEGRPYAVAFVDVRMPPGWNGIETIANIWREFPDLQMVICTAYSDYSWDEIARTIGNSDQMLVLKKPFDNLEVMQMAHALTKKWQLTKIARRQMAELDAIVNQRTAELSATNARLTSEIAERALAEEALRLSEERFSKAFHSSPIAMVIQRPVGIGCLDVNRSFLELLGVERAAVLSGQTRWWADESIGNSLREQLGTLQVVRNVAATLTTSRGEKREVLVTGQVLKLGDVPFHLLILQDITQRTRLENELRQAQKMEAVGQLAAGVAHDFNNILAVILGNTSLQLSRPRLDGNVTRALQQVVRAAEQATALTRQLLAYSRKQVLLRRPLPLKEAVEPAVSMLRRLIGEHIAIELQLAPDLPPIFADRISVEQVIINLVLNARDAMPDVGRVQISSSVVEVHETGPHVQASPGSYVCLSVRDNGHGMDAATLERIFEPFFTTKQQGKGTGMGLATVYGILKQHEGWVEVNSAPGCGTEVKAFFPVSKEAVPVETSRPASQPIASAAPGRFTILIVEDEQMLRDFVTDALGSLGYRIFACANARRALELWAEHREEIDLLLTDVFMPEISGNQLAKQLKAEKPELKVIFTSGYSAELLQSKFEPSLQDGFLAKPYRIDSLTRTVAAQLNATAAASS